MRNKLSCFSPVAALTTTSAHSVGQVTLYWCELLDFGRWPPSALTMRAQEDLRGPFKIGAGRGQLQIGNVHAVSTAAGTGDCELLRLGLHRLAKRRGRVRRRRFLRRPDQTPAAISHSAARLS